jgi:hypothetical protein
LREEGVEFITTRDDAHHKNFHTVVSLLSQRDDTEDVPTFIPSPFTGRFRELEDALLQMQRGFLGAQNPFYPGVRLDVSKTRAATILNQFSPTERELFLQLARAYKEREAGGVAVGEE